MDLNSWVLWGVSGQVTRPTIHVLTATLPKRVEAHAACVGPSNTSGRRCRGRALAPV